MKVLWIYPINRRCGISMYSAQWIAALTPFCTISELDCTVAATEPHKLARALAQVDVVHIQYEASLFFVNGKDAFSSMCVRIKKPCIVTVHEVYEQFPYAHPRESIIGSSPFAHIKRFLWDMKHPALAGWYRAVKNSFNAKQILVHAYNEKDILVRKGCTAVLIENIIHPVPTKIAQPSWPQSDLVHIGSSGFVNPQFEYDLLFSALDNIALPWKFTWIGGLRTSAEEEVLKSLKQKIADREWEDRFIITGWVSESRRNELLASLNIYCALFASRSGSGSLSTALAARRSIIATRTPAIEEMCAIAPIVSMVKHEREWIVSSINRLATDTVYREKIIRNLDTWCEMHTYAAQAPGMVKRYEAVLQH